MPEALVGTSLPMGLSIVTGLIAGGMRGLKQLLFLCVGALSLYLFIFVSLNAEPSLAASFEHAVEHLPVPQSAVAHILAYLLLLASVFVPAIFAGIGLSRVLEKLSRTGDGVAGTLLGGMLGYALFDTFTWFGLGACVLLALVSLMGYFQRRVPSTSEDRELLRRLQEQQLQEPFQPMQGENSHELGGAIPATRFLNRGHDFNPGRNLINEQWPTEDIRPEGTFSARMDE